jgi:Major Facilitator Superfamily
MRSRDWHHEPVIRSAPADLRRARVAVAAAFLVNGAVIADWVPRVPAVKHALGLRDGELGLALLGLGVGAALALLGVAGRLVARFGSRPVVRAAGAAYCAALVGPALARGLGSLAAALFLFGAAAGLYDVAMNAHASLLERTAGRPMMTGFHSLFSLGGLAGAVAGGLAAAAGWSPLRHFLVAAACLGALALLSSAWLLPATADAPQPTDPNPPDPSKLGRPPWSRAVLLLGLIGFSSVVGEGAAHDWSAVYLRDSLGTSPGMAATAFAAFSLTMTAVRVVGDRLQTRLGPVRLVRLSGTVAAVGLGLGLLGDRPVTGVAGFALLGGGLACVVPIAFSAAGNLGGPAGVGISRVAGISYLPIFIAPPVIGLVADRVGLPLALGLPVAFAALVAACARGVATAA